VQRLLAIDERTIEGCTCQRKRQATISSCFEKQTLERALAEAAAMLRLRPRCWLDGGQGSRPFHRHWAKFVAELQQGRPPAGAAPHETGATSCVSIGSEQGMMVDAHRNQILRPVKL
jgi:hypothetical protein